MEERTAVIADLGPFDAQQWKILTTWAAGAAAGEVNAKVAQARAKRNPPAWLYKTVCVSLQARGFIAGPFHAVTGRVEHSTSGITPPSRGCDSDIVRIVAGPGSNISSDGDSVVEVVLGQTGHNQQVVASFLNLDGIRHRVLFGTDLAAEVAKSLFAIAALERRNAASVDRSPSEGLRR
jgi:hypothetical protein